MPERSFDRWNMKYISTLASAKDSGYWRSGYLDKLKDLVRAGMQERYDELIENPETEIGQANRRTCETFAQNGLDYSQWLDYNGVHRFEVNNAPHTIRVWDRATGTLIRTIPAQSGTVLSLAATSGKWARSCRSRCTRSPSAERSATRPKIIANVVTSLTAGDALRGQARKPGQRLGDADVRQLADILGHTGLAANAQ